MGSPLRLPKVDFSALDPASPSEHGWDAVRERVMQALESYGCFEAVYDRVAQELLEALFGKTMQELFAVPLENKVRNTSDKPFHGYVGQIPGMDYESLNVDDITNRESAESFAALLWPGGNPSFCDTVCTLAKSMSELDHMVRRMVLESLGVEKGFESHIESTRCGLRLSEYGAPPTQETKISLPLHTDVTILSIVVQHQVAGLEILTKDGNWISPSPNSFIVMIGEAFWAWSNGRLEPPHHRVIVSDNKPRYSAIYGAYPKNGYMVEASEELVDEEHPLQLMPYEYRDYLQFCFSDAGRKAECALKAYCGVRDERGGS